MKNRENDLARLKSLLIKNKFGSDDRFEKLFYKDLCSVLKDYFEMLGEPLINIQKTQTGYAVSASFNAASIKNVKTIES